MYVSARQFPSSFAYVLVRTDGEPDTLGASVRREIADLDPDEPASNVQTMETAIAQSLPRFNVVLLGGFASIAWLLAVVGVYGVTSYSVAQRMHEFGVRMALGASARTIVSTVASEILKVAVIAGACGIAAALVVGRAIAGLLYGVSSGDFSTLLLVVGSLVMTIIIAALLAARRGATADPIVALRGE